MGSGTLIALVGLFLMGADHGEVPLGGGARAHKSRAKVEFAVVAPQHRFKTSGSIWLEYELTNHDRQNVWIDGAIAVGPPSVPETMRNVVIELRDKTGRLQSYSCMDKRALPGSSGYRVLAPGERLTVRQYLSCYDLKAGRYVVEARYHDANLSRPPPPSDAAPVFETLTAAPITIEIESGRSK